MEKQQVVMEREYAILTILGLGVFLAVIGMLTGLSIFDSNSFNTYALQADSWRQGRLDLPENYSWLEIAQYQGKYYCSFPPFPSYVLFPLTFLFGSNTPDGLVLFFFDVLAVLCLYKIALHFDNSPQTACFEALFFTICTNMTFVMYNPAVWFLAQSMSFALAACSIYMALKGKGGFSLFFWSCGVGCRPMQALFLPVLFFLLYKYEKGKMPDKKWYELILAKAYWALPALGIAISYMVLNQLRFGNVAEFGHNYLPEFLYEHQQFSTDYLAGNFKMLMHLPQFDENGKMMIDHFGNLNFLWVNPPILIALIGILLACIRREKRAVIVGVMTIVLSACYLVVTMMHATMGGWHFGNRYSNDILPWLYLPLVMVLAKHPRLVKYQIPFAIWGLMFNVVGTIIVYNGL